MPIDHPPRSATVQPGARLFVLGDSISIHYGPYLEKMLAGRFLCDRKGGELLASPEEQDLGQLTTGILARLAELDPGTPEVNGGDSAAVLSYLRSHRLETDILLLNCGLHDLKVDPLRGTHQVELEEYARNLEEILRLATAASRWVVWVRSTPVADERHNRMNTAFYRFNADVRSYNAAADERLHLAGIPSIDLYSFTRRLCRLAGDLDELYLDHVHFTEAVRRVQGAYIAGWLEAYRYA